MKIIIELEVECERAGDAFDVVESILDNGVLQDEINEHDVEDAGSIHVVSAICKDDSERERAERLYLNLACSQFRARVAHLEDMHEEAPTRTRTRWLKEARAALQAAEDDARIIFNAVLRGELALEAGGS